MTYSTWLNLTKQELQQLLVSLAFSKDHNTVSKAVYDKVFERVKEMGDPVLQARYQAYRDAVETDDELECDADSIVSDGDDPGAFVMTWTWVTNTQAGIEDEDEDEEEDQDQP